MNKLPKKRIIRTTIPLTAVLIVIFAISATGIFAVNGSSESANGFLDFLQQKISNSISGFFSYITGAQILSPTTVGTLSLYPTIENIGVISSFTGDDNGNNNAVLEYREVGSATWKPGITMTVDRRAILTG